MIAVYFTSSDILQKQLYTPIKSFPMFIAPPVRFSALPEAERNKSIQSGHPIILNCELSDASAQVHWYKDGSKLLSQTGVDILTDGLARKMTIQSAEFFHSGQYCCKTKGDSITFNVDIKGDQFCFEQCDTLTGYSLAKQLTRIRLLPFVLLPFLLTRTALASSFSQTAL